MNNYAAVGQIAVCRFPASDAPDTEFPGGIGLYALSGLLLSDPSSMLITGVGRDFDRYFGAWFERNEATRRGLKYRTDYCNRNEIRLGENGAVEEISVYGEVFHGVNYWESEIFARDLAPYLKGLKGLWTSGLWEDVYTDEMTEMRDREGFRLLWNCVPAQQIGEDTAERILKTAAAADIWSLGRGEGRKLFSAKVDSAVTEELRRLGKPCLYRAGTEGVYFISGNEMAYVPAVRSVGEQEREKLIGTGECSSAAALAAFCEGKGPREICICASVAAGFHNFCLGPIGEISPEKFREATGLFSEN